MELARLVQKLDRVRANERSPANWNGLAMAQRPALDPETLEAIEGRLGIRLPEEYRAYLTQVADGGMGPGYGLYPLEEAIERRNRTIYGLHQPFEPPRSTRECWSDWVPGMLPLHHDGCAYYTGLVVAGPARGSVWSYVEVAPGWVPLLRPGYTDANGDPYVDPESGRDFARWYDVLLSPANEGFRMGFIEHLEQWADGYLAGS